MEIRFTGNTAPIPLSGGSSLKTQLSHTALKGKDFADDIIDEILPPSSTPVIIAHRGAALRAPENTMASFREAYSQKADVIELDVHRTKDGHLVVMHDPRVDRTTDGTGEIRNMTLEEVKKLDAGSWFGPQFNGEKVPALEDVLDWAKGKVRVDIELKDTELYPGIEKDLIDMIRKRNAAGDIMITSFNRKTIETVQQLAPEIKTGYLFTPMPMVKALKAGSAAGAILGLAGGLSAGLSPLLTAGVTLAGGVIGFFISHAIGKKVSLKLSLDEKPDILIPHWSLIDKKWVNKAHEKNTTVYAYTANKPKLVHKLLSYYGVDGIITDNPGEFAEWFITTPRNNFAGKETSH